MLNMYAEFVDLLILQLLNRKKQPEFVLDSFHGIIWAYVPATIKYKYFSLEPK